MYRTTVGLLEAIFTLLSAICPDVLHSILLHFFLNAGDPLN